MRTKNTPAEELGLIGADDEAIIAGMVAHPVLVERPFVATPKGCGCAGRWNASPKCCKAFPQSPRVLIRAGNSGKPPCPISKPSAPPT
ncbi:hypothetical protein QWZ10_12775 [Paracoccus cavernae]|uniref:Uncharacterized protein n=1 Tax=Paracoccus cavernae TaxID=1571207 RepID=A0ABT8D6L7_9RHOB|nr:hypothetical protein [Paracoccus cavernae]